MRGVTAKVRIQGHLVLQLPPRRVPPWITRNVLFASAGASGQGWTGKMVAIKNKILGY